MAINFNAPAGFTTAVLIADTYKSGGGASDSIYTQLTKVNGDPVAAALEIKSTKGALLIPRMTESQKDDMDTVGVSAITDGMMIYNITAGAFQFRESGVWNNIAAGTISGPGASTDEALVRWDGTSGTLVKDSSVILSDAGKFTNVLSIEAAVGSVGVPTYTFTARNDTGMWSSAADTLDFSTAGLRQFQIANTLVAVNFLSVTGSATTLAPNITAHGADANVDIGLVAKAAGGISILPTTTNVVSPLKFWNAAGTFYTAFHAGAPGANVTWTLPSADATAAGQVLSSNAAGVLSWANANLQVATVTLTSPQLLALHATPIQLIAAPGANKMILVIGASAEFIQNTTPYTVPGGANLQFLIGATQAATAIAATGLIDQAAKTLSTTLGAALAGVAEAGLANTALTIKNSNATEFTLGDGTLAVNVTYIVISV